MKIVLWIGNEPNQRALANKIHSEFPLAGIITETRVHKRKITFAAIVEKIYSITGKFAKIKNAWLAMKDHYSVKFPKFPSVKILNVQNINSDEAYNFTKGVAPDLIIVSGTSLVKEKMLSLKPGIGILNLHTGISPYIKGGPNCTNWCIATEQFHLIGNTIMWIDAGIDSGNILTTEFTELNGEEDLPDIHLKVMEHAHALYIKAVKAVAQGNRNSVPQNSIAEGKTYYNKDWDLQKKYDLLMNLKKFMKAHRSGEVAKLRTTIKVVGL